MNKNKKLAIVESAAHYRHGQLEQEETIGSFRYSRKVDLLKMLNEKFIRWYFKKYDITDREQRIQTRSELKDWSGYSMSTDEYYIACTEEVDCWTVKLNQQKYSACSS